MVAKAGLAEMDQDWGVGCRAWVVGADPGTQALASQCLPVRVGQSWLIRTEHLAPVSQHFFPLAALVSVGVTMMPCDMGQKTDSG